MKWTDLLTSSGRTDDGSELDGDVIAFAAIAAILCIVASGNARFTRSAELTMDGVSGNGFAFWVVLFLKTKYNRGKLLSVQSLFV